MTGSNSITTSYTPQGNGGIMSNYKIAWLLISLSACFVLFQNRTVLATGPVRKESHNAAEYYAWEKTPQGIYKQVKKSYFMDKELCDNVINVLNDMSTKEPPSNWVLSHTTDSTFECLPASVNPTSASSTK
jgi:hypothetical protein